MDVKELIDQLQITYQCCGASEYQDWFNVSWISTSYVNMASPAIKAYETTYTLVFYSKYKVLPVLEILRGGGGVDFPSTITALLVLSPLKALKKILFQCPSNFLLI